MIGRVKELWRYPVKSMGGEQLSAVELLPYGIAGDRLLALESAGAPVGKPLLSGAERTAILLCHARLRGEAGPEHFTAGDSLSPFVEILLPAMAAQATYPAVDPALIPALQQYLGANYSLWLKSSTQPMTDCRPLALLSIQTVRQLSGELGFPVDARRFRANVLMDLHEAGSQGFPEDRLVGRRIQLGSAATLTVKERDPRCRIITLDPTTGEAMPALMRHVAREHEGKVGIYAATAIPGPLATGDPIYLLD